MSRSIWKGPFTRTPTLQLRKQARKNSSEALHESGGVVKIWSRAFMIVPSDLSRTYLVYSGKKWVKVRVVQQMIGHRFGEFCTTRQATVHKVYKQKQTHRKSASLSANRTHAHEA